MQSLDTGGGAIEWEQANSGPAVLLTTYCN
jgi:hypothetical protein